MNRDFFQILHTLLVFFTPAKRNTTFLHLSVKFHSSNLNFVDVTGPCYNEQNLKKLKVEDYKRVIHFFILLYSRIFKLLSWTHLPRLTFTTARDISSQEPKPYRINIIVARKKKKKKQIPDSSFGSGISIDRRSLQGARKDNCRGTGRQSLLTEEGGSFSLITGDSAFI